MLSTEVWSVMKIEALNILCLSCKHLTRSFTQTSAQLPGCALGVSPQPSHLQTGLMSPMLWRSRHGMRLHKHKPQGSMSSSLRILEGQSCSPATVRPPRNKWRALLRIPMKYGADMESSKHRRARQLGFQVWPHALGKESTDSRFLCSLCLWITGSPVLAGQKHTRQVCPLQVNSLQNNTSLAQKVKQFLGLW